MNPTSDIRVLVIEDESELADAVQSYLNLDGYLTASVGSLQGASAWLQRQHADILLLDLGLPDGDALDWLMQRGAVPETGVIITTARGEEAARIRGSQAGADAYLVKPVSLPELSCLIGNLARRLTRVNTKGWMLDAMNWSLLSPDGVSIELTNNERSLMRRLAQTPGQPVSRDEIARALGVQPQAYDARRLEVLVRRLRKKADACLGYPFPLQTAHRVGYAFLGPIEAVGLSSPAPASVPVHR
ncbi:response regulator transcription factor [Hydrogenophaga sp.]|uniref:response regulator transcription factor n=1 Tax=Hydrogenophaga sp. TaxID=1904254 RepID=UPI00286DAB95|nr:response regulator transcription factor [Hydrogenophaga sp.]